MDKISKRTKSAMLIKENSSLFRCPICSSTMAVMDSGRLECQTKHSFDISKQGYVNLLSTHHKTKYDQMKNGKN